MWVFHDLALTSSASFLTVSPQTESASHTLFSQPTTNSLSFLVHMISLYVSFYLSWLSFLWISFPSLVHVQIIMKIQSWVNVELTLKNLVVQWSSVEPRRGEAGTSSKMLGTESAQRMEIKLQFLHLHRFGIFLSKTIKTTDHRLIQSSVSFIPQMFRV